MKIFSDSNLEPIVYLLTVNYNETAIPDDSVDWVDALDNPTTSYVEISEALSDNFCNEVINTKLNNGKRIVSVPINPLCAYLIISDSEESNYSLYLLSKLDTSPQVVPTKLRVLDYIHLIRTVARILDPISKDPSNRLDHKKVAGIIPDAVITSSISG